jgi:tRNA (guanine-N7-)-methyltransferase
LGGKHQAEEVLNTSGQAREIRSFVRREGRLTPGQHRAIEALWADFGIEAGPARLDLTAVFGRQAPRGLEIGFGDGEALSAMAQAHPDQDFLGIEVHRPGIGRLLMRAEALGLSNLRIIRGDAVDVLSRQLPDACLDQVSIYFPDPWPKKRHHKRRLIQTAFADLLARKLKHHGSLHLATDWEDYAWQMLEILEASRDFANASGGNRFAPRAPHRPLTRFEHRGERLGHPIRDLVFKRL